MTQIPPRDPAGPAPSPITFREHAALAVLGIMSLYLQPDAAAASAIAYADAIAALIEKEGGRK